MSAEIARRMGWADAFRFRGPADIFREHAALSGFENDGSRLFDIGALASLTDAEYGALAPVRWPLPAGAAPGADGRLFGDGRFATEDGKGRFVPTPWRPPASRTDRRRPFILNTGRVRDQWHTMTRTGRMNRLMSHQDEPWLDIAPGDALMLGLAAGDLARVETEHGRAILRARPNEAQRRGEVFVPMHWTDDFCSAGPVDRLVGAARDPLSGQPEFKATPVGLAPVPTLWRGLLLAPWDRLPQGEFYCCRIPVAGGHAFELRGWDMLPTGRALTGWAAALLGPTEGDDPIEIADPACGAYRLVDLDRGRLRACLLLSMKARWPIPDRLSVQMLLGTPVDADATRRLVTIDESAASPPPRARTVCACFSVAHTTIEDAIVADRLQTVAEIGTALRAGTNCGSCIPELKEILRDASVAA
jgi:assimilatory nitrate reductase catalytic subunit